MKKYIIILLSFTLMLTMAVEPAMAAPAQTSQTQKQREKARKQAQKEKEKARKKAQKDKEKARKQAQKDKEKARKQAQKEKEAARKQGQKPQAAPAPAPAPAPKAEKAAPAPAPKAEKVAPAPAPKVEKAAPAPAPKVDKAAQQKQAAQQRAAAQKAAEQDRKQAVADEKARQKEIAAARKAGDKTWYTKTKDIHSLNFYLGGGYANILNKHDNGSNIGGGGAMLGINYELRHDHFLFNIGPEFRFLSSADKFNTKAMENGVEYAGMEYYYDADMKETQTVGQVMVPIMFGGTFDKVYFLVGTKIGYAVIGNWNQTGTLKTTVHDPDAYADIWQSLGNHYQTSQPIGDHPLYDASKTSGSHNFGLDVMASAEVGVNLEEFFSEDWKERNEAKAKPWHFRVAAFVDYGLPLKSFDKVAGEPVSLNPTATVPQQRGEMLHAMQTNTSLLESGATSGKLSSLLVGVKLTAQLQLTKPKLPNPRMVVRVEDAFTGKPIANAKVSFHMVGDRRKPQLKGLKKDGSFTARYAKGQYDMLAVANGYLDSDPVVYEHRDDLTGPEVFRLIPRPLLTVMVHDQNTGHLIPATVNFTSDQTAEQSLLNVPSGASGKISLHYGDTYQVRIAAAGYHDTTATVSNLYGTEDYYLTPLVRIRRVLVLKNMYFAVDRTEILPGSEAEIEKLHRFLVENPKIRVLITGHTDSDGSEMHNQTLSEGRAASLKNEMVQRGIDADRMETNGKGESEPIDTNETEAGKANNRRIEVTVLNADEATVDVY